MTKILQGGGDFYVSQNMIGHIFVHFKNVQKMSTTPIYHFLFPCLNLADRTKKKYNLIVMCGVSNDGMFVFRQHELRCRVVG